MFSIMSLHVCLCCFQKKYIYKINSVHKILIGKTDGRRTIERSSHGSENNIKTDLKTGSGFVDEIHVTQDWIHFWILREY